MITHNFIEQEIKRIWDNKAAEARGIAKGRAEGIQIGEAKGKEEEKIAITKNNSKYRY